jgi:trk system potassium uptake protein TrkH
MIYLPELSFTDAYFETMSGMTTTGATTFTGLDRLPPSINLWRCQLQWLGGLGIIVLAVAILPLLGVGGAQVFKAEAPGPMKDTKLTPRITETAKGLWMVYFVATVVCVVAYRWAGMTWLDALSHAFSTMSLGGFSPHDASFGYFDSPRIELVSIVFMLFASVNFATHFVAWRKRSLAAYARDPEAFAVLGVMLGSVLLIAAFLWWRDFYPAFGQALRFAAFNTISAASTTGYASTDYDQWPVFAPVWLIFLSMWAASSGSTGGGIKMVRALLLIKQALAEFTRILHPRAQLTVKLRGSPVEANIVFAVLAFMLVYGASVIVTTFLLAATGLDIITAFSAVMAAINNLGPGLSKVGPAQNFAVLTDLQTWVLSFTMLLGRLELFTLLVVFTPAFWRK